MNTSEKNTYLVKKAAGFVKQLFRNHLPCWAVYHNLNHTADTVMHSENMAQYYGLNPGDTEALLIAAWLHDTGYIEGPQEHEKRSVQKAISFLKQYQDDKELETKVEACIKATDVNSSPGTLIEYIMRDADLASLGGTEYFYTNELLRQEFEMREGRDISEAEWLRRSEKFLASHSYFSEYAKIKFNKQLQANLAGLRKKIKLLS